MLNKTAGIVLNHIKYTDSSIIVTIYTKNFGKQSYIIKNIHGKKSKIKFNLFRPLSILELEIIYREKRELQTLSEARIAHPYGSLHNDILKSSLALFISEILFRSLREETSNIELYNFLELYLLKLDAEIVSIENFHIFFLMQLTRLLGFFPTNNYSESSNYFDLMEGNFTSAMPPHPYIIDKELCSYFSLLINMNYEASVTNKIPKKTRDELLIKLIEYYQVQLISFPEIKSLKILKEIFV